MKKKEFKDKLKDIAERAKKQEVGPYTPQSDAMAALSLINELVLLLLERMKDE